MHLTRWIDACIEQLPIPQKRLPFWLLTWWDATLMHMLTALQIGELRDAHDLADLEPRVAYFIAAARERGIECKILYILDRPTEHIVLQYNGKHYYFHGYPTAEHANASIANAADNKATTKKHLQRGGFPVAAGKHYYVWQKEHAIRESIRSIGFPLVVKPKRGTFSRHVTTDINDEAALRRGIAHAVAYQPSFIVEQYFKAGSVHRVTVIDFTVVAAARQAPATVVGNGADSIATLMESKNAERRALLRRNPHAFVQEIPEPRALDLSSVPKVNETIMLHRNPFLRLGADVIDETARIHPDNVRLCEAVARHFDIRCVGMDIMFEDISRPWSEQRCAILELNSLPSIEMHHTPMQGEPRDVAGALVDLFFKYYVS